MKNKILPLRAMIPTLKHLQNKQETVTTSKSPGLKQASYNKTTPNNAGSSGRHSRDWHKAAANSMRADQGRQSRDFRN
ncbi:hypothetical protein [Pontibacter sp. SGAir0037]|uniref:hypothetical protein n=1 Tax=Pontibacter sp. SGAir0037 TaxID=2571030 RepID=UPI0010CD1346|nr:hypothetical protein [Pontibacter sp. SGAir0037]QCR23497.1 hypothetical protein C1N53_14870 [Pontibacter sp. SGAir0037]